MKKSILILQGSIVLIAMAALFFMVRFPLLEGRAANLDLINIYTDPFIIFSYIASVPFFMALYNLFALLGLIGREFVFSYRTLTLLRHIRFYIVLEIIFIGLAALYIKLFHNKDDDPAGFLALCILAILTAIIILSAVNVFEKIIQTGINKEAQNLPGDD